MEILRSHDVSVLVSKVEMIISLNEAQVRGLYPLTILVEGARVTKIVFAYALYAETSVYNLIN